MIVVLVVVTFRYHDFICKVVCFKKSQSVTAS